MNKKTRKPVMSIYALMLIISGFGVMPAMADSDATNNDKWQFEITPYLFAAGMDGTVGMRGISADIDMSFNDILERLDKALMLYFTARKGDWVYAIDAIYFSIEDEAASSWQGPLGNTNTAQLNADLTQQAYALSAGRRVLNQRTKIDVLGVARYTSLDTTLKLALATGSDLLPDGSRSVSGNVNWWDAAIAVKILVPIATKWDLVGYADIGAGGSDLTYQLLAGVNWQFSNTFSAKLGYRLIYQDYQKDDFKWDMTTSGGYAGLGIRF